MNRAAVRAALVQKLQESDALTGVQVTLVWPGDQTEAEAIYLLPSQGTMSVPVLHGVPSTSNPLTFQDDFTVPIAIQAAKRGQDDATAEARIEELITAVITTIATGPTLGDVDGLFHALITEIEGPGPAPSKTGVQAFARVVIECRSR